MSADLMLLSSLAQNDFDGYVKPPVDNLTRVPARIFDSLRLPDVRFPLNPSCSEVELCSTFQIGGSIVELAT